MFEWLKRHLSSALYERLFAGSERRARAYRASRESRILAVAFFGLVALVFLAGLASRLFGPIDAGPVFMVVVITAIVVGGLYIALRSAQGWR